MSGPFSVRLNPDIIGFIIPKDFFLPALAPETNRGNLATKSNDNSAIPNISRLAKPSTLNPKPHAILYGLK